MSEKIEMVIEDIKDFVDNLDQPSLPSSTSSNVKIKTFSFNFTNRPEWNQRNIFYLYMLDGDSKTTLFNMREWWKENSDRVLHIKAGGNYILNNSKTGVEMTSAKNIFSNEVNTYIFSNVDNELVLPVNVENCFILSIRVNASYPMAITDDSLDENTLPTIEEMQNFRFFIAPKAVFTGDLDDSEDAAFFQVFYLPYLGLPDVEGDGSSIIFDMNFKCNIDVSFMYVEE